MGENNDMRRDGGGGGKSSYERMEFMTHSRQREKVREGEMAYDENEDVGWQCKEEEHVTCIAATSASCFL